MDAGSGVELSFVCPVYRCPGALNELCDRIAATARGLGRSFEIVLVDDRCPENSWSVVTGLARQRPEVRGVRLSRNFGQHAAIEAGLARARGRWIVVLDCDLQDPPEQVKALLAKAEEGYDVVRARRLDRQDSFLRRLLSRGFWALLGWLTRTRQDAAIGNFGIYHRKVTEAVLSWSEPARFFPVTVGWVGFAQTDIDIPHAARRIGRSSYRLSDLLALAFAVALPFADRPLRLVVVAGCGVATLSIAASVALLGVGLPHDVGAAGLVALTLSVWFLGGLGIAMSGMACLCAGRAVAAASQRPTYIVDEDTGRPGAVTDATP